MDRSLYLAMSGAKQTLLAQAANGHNLANVSTTGFRRDLEQFRAMPVFGPGFPSRVYAMSERPAVDFGAGPFQTTGRALDVAVEGEGWIAVQAPGGGEAYTRAGDFRLTPEGLLQTGTGLAVLGENGPVAIPPAARMEIGADGTISIVPLGEGPGTLMVLDRIKLVNPPGESLEKRADGLIYPRNGTAAEADAGVRLARGVLEGSNVSTAEALVRMVELSRQFELQIKTMQAADDNEAASAQLMRLG